MISVGKVGDRIVMIIEDCKFKIKKRGEKKDIIIYLDKEDVEKVKEKIKNGE